MAVLSAETETLHDIRAREDAAHLQGDWHFLSGNRPADVSFHDDQFVVRFHNGEVFRGTFSLNPLHHPKALDLSIQEGPRNVGRVSLGIYEIDGKFLALCPGVPGSGERPKFFPPADNCNFLTWTFKRAKADK